MMTTMRQGYKIVTSKGSSNNKQSLNQIERGPQIAHFDNWQSTSWDVFTHAKCRPLYCFSRHGTPMGCQTSRLEQSILLSLCLLLEPITGTLRFPALEKDSDSATSPKVGT